MTDSNRSGRDPRFRVLETDHLTHDHFIALTSGTVAAVQVHGMLPEDSCRSVVGQLDAVPLDIYDPRRVDPPIVRFGPVLNDYRRDGALSDEYWPHAVHARRAWAAAGIEPDPLDRCVAYMSGAWRGEIGPARHQGRDMFAGMIREINDGARIHYDDVGREFAGGLFDEPVTAQLAFNLYLSMPSSGGETTIWRRRWNPRDAAASEGYGYAESVISDEQMITLRPSVGDGILFDPRNYHAVRPGRGSRRIALAFFLGMTGGGNLVIWS